MQRSIRCKERKVHRFHQIFRFFIVFDEKSRGGGLVKWHCRQGVVHHRVRTLPKDINKTAMRPTGCISTAQNSFLSIARGYRQSSVSLQNHSVLVSPWTPSISSSHTHEVSAVIVRVLFILVSRIDHQNSAYMQHTAFTHTKHSSAKSTKPARKWVVFVQFTEHCLDL